MDKAACAWRKRCIRALKCLNGWRAHSRVVAHDQRPPPEGPQRLEKAEVGGSLEAFGCLD